MALQTTAHCPRRWRSRRQERPPEDSAGRPVPTVPQKLKVCTEGGDRGGVGCRIFTAGVGKSQASHGCPRMKRMQQRAKKSGVHGRRPWLWGRSRLGPLVRVKVSYRKGECAMVLDPQDPGVGGGYAALQREGPSLLL